VDRKKICFVTASELTIKAFLQNQIAALSQRYEVHVIVNTRNPDLLSDVAPKVKVIPADIERSISLWRDIRALTRLAQLFRRNRYDVIHSVTPKAGLLAMVAGLVSGVPVRMHMFTGQVWATRSGLNRALLKGMDKLLVKCGTHILVDSPSQRSFLIRQGVVSEDKSCVLAKGSISGVDLERFKPDGKVRANMREQLGIADGDTIFLFVGRLNRDKGVLDLATAFQRLVAGGADAHLLVVGPDEEGMQSAMLQLCSGHRGRLHFIGHTDSPERYMAAADVFCLPSYREGFGTVIIEAAAAGIPAVASDIYGITDAIEEGVSGLLFPPGDIEALACAMNRMLESDGTRQQFGDQARQRAIRDFSQQRLTEAVLEYYEGL